MAMARAYTLQRRRHVASGLDNSDDFAAPDGKRLLVAGSRAREEQRLSPPAGILYLFTACTACSLLGIILTFAPVSICPVYQHPVDRLGILSTIRGDWGLTSDPDQQIGGLLMWVPMCAIYAAAILPQLARWHSSPQPEQSNA